MYFGNQILLFITLVTIILLGAIFIIAGSILGTTRLLTRFFSLFKTKKTVKTYDEEITRKEPFIKLDKDS